jgi:hypothetical protein
LCFWAAASAPRFGTDSTLRSRVWGDCISVCDPVRKCVGLDRDGNAGGDFCLPKWNSAPLATLPHHRNSRGYTTFSTFSLDVALLYERGQIGVAAVYVLLSVVLSIGGLFAGLALVRNFA